MNTEFGKIAGLIENQTNGPTPLQTKLNNLSKILAILVIILCAFNFGFGILMKKDLMEMLLLNISLAVGVIPEGFQQLLL